MWMCHNVLVASVCAIECNQFGFDKNATVVSGLYVLSGKRTELLWRIERLGFVRLEQVALHETTIREKENGTGHERCQERKAVSQDWRKGREGHVTKLGDSQRASVCELVRASVTACE